MRHILLVEDHASFRQALVFFIERDLAPSNITQVGTLSEARPFLHDVDIAAVDLTLPDGDGVALIAELHAVNPRAKVLALTASVDPVLYGRAVEAGVAGVMHKSASIEDIIDALCRLAAGEWLLTPAEVVDLLRYVKQQRDQSREAQALLARLTSREREVLELLAQGLPSSEIAQRLYITIDTERTHMVNILMKLDVHSQLQALVFALRHGAVKIH